MIPSKKSQYFSTYMDNQSEILVSLYEVGCYFISPYTGEKIKVNSLIKKQAISGIPPAPRGKPQLEVCHN
jgi:L1 cell adhesion molecule like protein